ncbi:winged helix-turn-helix domain-containing protein [Pseudoflavonifractor phocaeensis]|uniref:winged helix-turn-helix domain-containing protein n=1 Tax=Pseudoflavonifractor phocaeensis TaxID=1870988 RepID=UPI001FAEEE5E|nr:winged helix-turn-helix domain-containing protein [Pseudoflavonifractor phocaeensis]
MRRHSLAGIFVKVHPAATGSAETWKGRIKTFPFPGPCRYRRVLMAGREVVLNHGEYAMLYCMASSPGQVFSKAQLYEAAWGEAYLHGTKSVENIIWRLRRKLEPDPRNPIYIKTVIGAGYKIEIPNNSGRQRR